MIDFYYQYQTLDRLKATLNTLKEALDIDSRKKELSELEALQEKEGFWNDIENAQKVNRQINAHRKKIDRFEDLDNRVKEFYQLLELIEEMQDEEEARVQRADRFGKEVNDLRIEALLKGKYDNLGRHTYSARGSGRNSAGLGGYACRMYTRYAERKGYQIKELDFLGDEAGIKSVTFQISGETHTAI